MVDFSDWIDACCMPTHRTPKCEADLLAEAALWDRHLSLDQLTVDAARELATERGIDFATAVLYDRLRKSQQYAELLQAFEAIDDPAEAISRSPPFLLAVMPGAFYRESPHSGADGQAIFAVADRLQIPCELVPTGSFGSLTENAEILHHWLSNREEDRIILVSLSKGGAEVKQYFNSPEAIDTERRVTGWVNLSGILEHSPMVEWLLGQRVRSRLVRLAFWWRGYDWNVLRAMADVADFNRPWRIPDHVRVIHVAGFPLMKHLSSPLARRGHCRIAHRGPNDAAGNLLAEVARRPGFVLPVWGADHYLRSPSLDSQTLITRVLALACRTDRSSVSSQQPVAGSL